MKSWRSLLLLTLLVVPLLVYGVVGGWALWQTGHLMWVWWVLPACWAAAYLFARLWRQEMVPRPDVDVTGIPHWTETDQRASRAIVAKQKAIRDVQPEQLADPQFYLQTAMELGLEITRVYHPDANDPVESLTVPEILAASRLALEDVEKWAQQYIPASHLLTVGQWRQLSKVPSWLRSVSDISWIASMLFRLGNIGRYAVWKVAMEPVTRKMNTDILAAFYVFFTRQVGYYLIEMNSGRLRGGADPYRQMSRRTGLSLSTDIRGGAPMGRADQATEDSDQTTADDEGNITIVLVGQINAGKSSVINALLGQQTAETDVLPQTDQVQRYRLSLADTGQQLILLDTPGLGGTAPARSQLSQTQRALEDADLVLLVMNASNPARDVDCQVVQETLAFFAEQPHRKSPPVIGVLTHIDSLPPALEWEPPYNWQTPTHLKEENIRGAVDYAWELLNDRVMAVVPVCSDVKRERTFGITEWLQPTIAACLDEARACAFLRLLHAETNRAKLQQLLRQLVTAGKAILQSAEYRSATPPRSR